MCCCGRRSRSLQLTVQPTACSYPRGPTSKDLGYRLVADAGHDTHPWKGCGHRFRKGQFTPQSTDWSYVWATICSFWDAGCQQLLDTTPIPRNVAGTVLEACNAHSSPLVVHRLGPTTCKDLRCRLSVAGGHDTYHQKVWKHRPWGLQFTPQPIDCS